MRKAGITVPIQLHCHYTSGMGSMAYMKGVEAGANIIDCAISPMSVQTSQPSIEVMCSAFEGTEFDTGLNLEPMIELADYWGRSPSQYAAITQKYPDAASFI